MGVQQKIITRTPAFLGTATVTDSTGAETTQALGGATGALAIGVPGNIYDASPARIHTESLTTAADIGTLVPGKGIIVNPREYALRGVSGNPLAPSLTLPAGTPASLMTFGHVVVKMKDLATIIAGIEGSVIVGPFFSATSTYAVGDLVIYDNAAYVCTTAVTTAGAWDSSKFTAYATQLPNGTDVCVVEINGLK